MEGFHSREAFDNAKTPEEKEKLISQAEVEARREDDDFKYAVDQKRSFTAEELINEKVGASPEAELQGTLSNDEKNILEKLDVYEPTMEQIAEFDAEIYDKLVSAACRIYPETLKLSNKESMVFDRSIRNFIGRSYVTLRNCYVKFGMKEGVKGNPGLTIEVNTSDSLLKEYKTYILNAPEIRLDDYRKAYVIEGKRPGMRGGDSIDTTYMDSIDLVEHKPENETKV